MRKRYSSVSSHPRQLRRAYRKKAETKTAQLENAGQLNLFRNTMMQDFEAARERLRLHLKGAHRELPVSHDA